MESVPEEDAFRLVHQLMYRALLDIRHVGRELKSGPVVGLADLFHTVPLELEKAARHESDYTEVLSNLVNKAREKNCESWIENQLQSFKDSQT